MAWTSPRTWVAGEVVTAALLNTHLRDNMKALGDPWTAWTPTVSAVTGSFTTATGAGRYMAVGKLIHWSCTVTITTVGTGGTGIRFTLPVNAQSATAYLGNGRERGATGTGLQVYTFSNTTAESTSYNNGFVLASGHIFMMSGTYESA